MMAIWECVIKAFIVHFCFDKIHFNIHPSHMCILDFPCGIIYSVNNSFVFQIDPLSNDHIVVDVSPPIACHGGTRGSIVRASAYAELDGKRKRQSIYPGSGPRS